VFNPVKHYIRTNNRWRNETRTTCCITEYIKLTTAFLFTFMGPFIVNVFKHNQQDATLHNGIYYYKCSTYFRRFLRPSTGAQNSIHSIGYLSSFYCFLPLAVRSSKSSTNTNIYNTRSILSKFI